MKKFLVLSAFLVGSTGYVFSLIPVTEASALVVPKNENDAAATSTASALLAHVESLEANIAKIEAAAAAALALKQPVPQAKTASASKPKISTGTTTSVVTTTVKKTATPTSSPATTSVLQSQRYNDASGVLREPNGTYVVAPIDAQQSVSGLWYAGGQAYAIGAPGAIGYSAPAPVSTTLVGPAPADESVSPVITTTPSPTTQATRHRDNDDDDDD